MLARQEAQCQVDNEGKDHQADDADRQALGTDGNRREEAGRKGDDGDDDGCLSDLLIFFFEGKFHQPSQWRWG